MALPPERLNLRLAMLRMELAHMHRRHRIVLAAVLADEERQRQRQRQRQRRRWWIKPWLLRRPLYGQYETLMVELEREHQADFRTFLRMEPQMFHELLQRVTPRIEKNTKQRQPLSAGLILAITLRFLATGSSYHSLAFDFRVAHNTISLFVPRVCDAIVAEYRDEVFKTPSTPDTWQPVADRFGQRWNFPHCCGALDGKHIEIVKPRKSGSLYYNYKGFFSIVMLALVDADYKFLWMNIGSNGSASDCGIFNRSPLEPALRLGTLGLPDPCPLPHDDQDTPFFIIGDDAFPLRPYLMKPYSGRYLARDERIFNYRCSRARRVVENAFGILASRFRCLLTPLGTTPEHTVSIDSATLTLHNVMRARYPNLQNADLDREDYNHRLIPGAWRDENVLQDVQAAGRGPRQTVAGKQQRTYLKNYFMSPAGSLPWQEQAVDV